MSRIYGVHATRDALFQNRVTKVYLSHSFKNQELLNLFNEKRVEVERVDKTVLDKLSRSAIHQGVVCEVKPYKVYDLNEVLNSIKGKTNPIVCILDELNDPHNLGAILRSADIFGVDAVIYKKHNSVSLSDTVAKVSCGGINYVKCIEVTNLSRCIQELKKNSFWVVGLAGEAKEDIKAIFKDRPLAIVIGSEGYGISRLVRENCDLLVKIPQSGHVPCLNASNAAAITFYEIRR